MKIQQRGITKNIWFGIPATNIDLFVLMIDNYEGSEKKLIKWSISNNGESPQYFMIDSINPLRVLGGIAPFSENIFHYLWETEEELMEFIQQLDYEKIVEMMKQSIFISHRDKMQMAVAPTEQIKLYEPTQEEIDFKNKLLGTISGIINK